MKKHHTRKHKLSRRKYTRRTRKSKQTRHRRPIMRGGGNINFKKYNGYDVYGNPIKNVSVSSPIEWDD